MLSSSRASFLTWCSAAAVAASMTATSPATAGSSAAEIRNCTPENWCAYHRTVDTAWRYSPLARSTRTMSATSVRPGSSSRASRVPGYAQHAARGRRRDVCQRSTRPLFGSSTPRPASGIWGYEPEMDAAINSRTFFAHTRGLAIGDGRVYVGTRRRPVGGGRRKDTGEVVWEQAARQLGEGHRGLRGAGTFVNSDLLVIGQNGGEYPIEGQDLRRRPERPATVKWTFYTTGRDDPEALATWGATRGSTAAGAPGSRARSTTPTTRS